MENKLLSLTIVPVKDNAGNTSNALVIIDGQLPLIQKILIDGGASQGYIVSIQVVGTNALPKEEEAELKPEDSEQPTSGELKRTNSDATETTPIPHIIDAQIDDIDPESETPNNNIN